MSTENTLSVGVRAWGTSPKRQRQQFDDDLPRLPFFKFKKGINDVRIVSNLGVYYQVKWKGPLSKSPFGDRVRTSYPTYDDCPVKKYLGLTGKERYTVVVIDRSDNELKLLDLSQLTVEAIETNLEVKNSRRAAGQKVTPRDFDISIKYDPDSKVATGYYSVVAHDTIPMSAEDLALIADLGGADVLDKIITKNTICPKPETVEKRLKALGWDGSSLVGKTKVVEVLEEPEEDDYSFNRPDELAAAV